MNKFMPMLKLAPEDDKGGGGGGAADDTKEKPNPPADSETPEAGGDETDEFGYPIQGSSEEKPAEEKKPDEQKKPDEKKDPVEEPPKVEGVAGYGDEPPEVKDLPPEKKEDEKPPEKKEPDELDKAIGTEGLDEDSIKGVKEFAAKIKATPEQAKELADFRRKELADARAWEANQQKEFENEKLRRRAAQYEELKKDKDFGGDNFKKNLHAVEKVLAEMPATKKILTETKGQLPTWIMRDLAVLSKKLFAGNEKLVNGEPNTPKTDDKEDNFLDEMYS